MRIKPAPGLSVRDPDTKLLLPPDGIDVPDNSILWTKMLNDKDVVLVPTGTAAKPAVVVATKEGEKQ